MEDVTLTHKFVERYTSPPDIITALSYVHITPGGTPVPAVTGWLPAMNTIGVKVSSEDIRHNQFTLQFGIWGNGGMSRNDCNWLGIAPGDTRYRSGEYQVHRHSVINAVLPITFSQPFLGVPIVVVWLSGFQMHANHARHLSVAAEVPTINGFSLRVAAPHAALYQAKICYFAYMAADPNIRSGTFNAANINLGQANKSIENTVHGTVNFNPVFPHGTDPARVRIIQGLSSFRIPHRPVITMEIYGAADINVNSFRWRVGSWGEMQCENVGVSYLAILDPA